MSYKQPWAKKNILRHTQVCKATQPMFFTVNGEQVLEREVIRQKVKKLKEAPFCRLFRGEFRYHPPLQKTM